MTEVWVMTPSYRGRHMNTLMRIKPAYVLHNIHYAKYNHSRQRWVYTGYRALKALA